MVMNSEQIAVKFFDELNDGIRETPAEKEERVERQQADTKKKHQEKLEQLRKLAGKAVEVPINIVDVSENIREYVDTESDGFKALAHDIEVAGGVLQYPVVSVIGTSGALRLVCLAGHRRILAAKKAGSEKIMVSVRAIASESDRLFVSLSENLVREDLHPLDIAKTLSKLKALGETSESLARRFGKNPKSIGHYIKMQDSWPEKARQLIRSHHGKFNARFLLVLARRKLSDKEIIKIIEEKALGTKRKTSKAFAGMAKIESFFEKKQMSERDKALVLEALRELKVIT